MNHKKLHCKYPAKKQNKNDPIKTIKSISFLFRKKSIIGTKLATFYYEL